MSSPADDDTAAAPSRPACDWDVAGWADVHAQRLAEFKPQCLLVLAGGVDEVGRVHATVQRRLDAAAELWRRSSGELAIMCNGGGTAHKPKFRDPSSGFCVPEAQLMAQHLLSAGVPAEKIVLEAFSDDTIGNAFAARALHTEWRPDWRRLVLITSDFQIDRAKAVYRWMFELEPSVAYSLTALGVPDQGVVDPVALAARAQRECASLHAFSSGVGARYTSLAQVHQWLFSTHEAYAPRTKARPPMDSDVMKTY
jgi:hypothetical protein